MHFVSGKKEKNLAGPVSTWYKKESKDDKASHNFFLLLLLHSFFEVEVNKTTGNYILTHLDLFKVPANLVWFCLLAPPSV